MNEWINAKDHLPEKDGRYLVCYNIKNSIHYKIEILYFQIEDEEGNFDDKKNVFYYDSEEWGYVEIDNVEYWMPLPELPKELEI